MTKQLTRLFTVLGAATLLFSACASQKGTTVTAGGLRKAATGSWSLNSITYEGLPSDAKISSVFSNIPPDCLKGSRWVLPSNSKGSYTVNSSAAGCAPGTQNIVWSTINQGGSIMLQFKEVMTGEKAKNVLDGYRVELAQADGSSMVWRAPVTHDGKTAYIVYSFSRQ
ncbi:hypothetical protein ACQKLP_02585 [Chitinophaga sp. NPDC101104]|uniref:hypothetical protein n=1 Tax=Chitinophaga sp. NPDC101104 TaxID=3390561 RepID=UPI003D033D35